MPSRGSAPGTWLAPRYCREFYTDPIIKGVLPMKSTRRLIGKAALGIVALGLVLMVAAAPAHALVLNFTSDHCTGGCGTPPFGTVTLTQNGTTVDVHLHLNSPNFFVKTGSADFMAFKFNAVDVVKGDITVNQN